MAKPFPGSDTPAPAPAPQPPSRTDESKYEWRPHSPGFEINQHGHIRTRNYQPPSTMNDPDEYI